jgi:integrase
MLSDPADRRQSIRRSVDRHDQEDVRKSLQNLRERLREIRGSDTWVFCSPRRTDKPLSRNTLYVAVQSTGFLDRTCVHGFRSTFSSLAVGYCKVNPLIAELCIGHKIKLSMEDTYQRWHFLEEKRQALQAWADFIDRVREGRS